MKTKFAIGCLVQWYEVDIIEEYIKTLKEAMNSYDGEILVDFTICMNQDLEKCVNKEQLELCRANIGLKIMDIRFKTTFTKKLVTIADYRRQFNEKYCELADVLMWGESDALIPKQTFNILDSLHQMSLQNSNPKYLAFFGTCKMWDSSWKCVEHIDMTNKPVDNQKWWGTRYYTSIEEMHKINSKVDKSSNKEGGLVIGGNNESVSGVNQKKEGTVTQTAPKSNPKKKTYKKSNKQAGGADNMLIYLAIGGIIYFMYFHKKK